MKLTATSYIVLGLLELAREATPYELKQGVSASVGNFWSVPHSQLYAEPERLARGGYLDERRERGGRRRRIFSLTDRGREALATWRDEPEAEMPEYRDAGLLKIFFGADPAAVARARLADHEAVLEEYRRMRALDTGAEPRGPWITLDAGIAHQEEWVEFWKRLA